MIPFTGCIMVPRDPFTQGQKKHIHKTKNPAPVLPLHTAVHTQLFSNK